MIEVTKDKFFEIIAKNKLDVVSKIEGKYPYKHNFVFRNGVQFGRIEDSAERGVEDKCYVETKWVGEK
jgi:hypothetical protein